MKLHFTNTDDAARFIVAGLLVILAGLMWVLAHPVPPVN